MELVNTSDWKYYVGDRHIYSVVAAEQYIRSRMLPQQERLGYGNHVIELGDTAIAIGTVGLYDREGVEGLDLGYALLPAFYGRGYATEASAAMVDYGRHLGCDTLRAYTMPNNQRSVQVLERLGFDVVGTMQLPDDEIELLHYQLELI